MKGHSSAVCVLAIALLASCARSLEHSGDIAQAQVQFGVESPAPTAPVLVALEPYVGRLLMTRVIMGTDTLRMLFDTGAGLTLVTPEVARRMGCVPSGEIRGFRMTGEPVSFAMCPSARMVMGGRLPVHQSPIGVFDLGPLLPAGLPSLDGVLSLQSFAGHTVTVDLACHRLIVETARSARDRIRMMHRLSSRIASGEAGGSLVVFLRVDASPVPRWLEFDSANLDHVLVSPGAAASFGIDTTRSSDSTMVTIGVSGLEPVRVSASARHLVHDGALNERFIARGVFTLDLAHGMAWGRLAPNDQSCRPRAR